MHSADVVGEIKRIISEVAGIPLSDLEDDLRMRDELMLDSLKEMEIVARTEIKLGVILDEGKLIGIQTLGEYCAAVINAKDVEAATR
jgi:acyl carrier protein